MACAEWTFLSAAFDVDFDSDFLRHHLASMRDKDREGHGFSRARYSLEKNLLFAGATLEERRFSAA